jgi:ATP-dependent Lon protease
MSQMGDDLAFVPEEFSGRARLFPLPNLVLFPHVIQPLHVFEERYVALLHEALADDRLIAMALLDTGWEHDYEGRPPLAPVACLGRIMSCQAQPENRFNLLLMGLRRVRIVRELEPHKSFREAEVEVLDDEYSPAHAETRAALHRKLVTAFEKMLPRIADADELFNKLSMNSVSLGALSDVISYALDMDVQHKQKLLAEKNVDRRTKMLLKHLKIASKASQGAANFPPAFSCN